MNDGESPDKYSRFELNKEIVFATTGKRAQISVQQILAAVIIILVVLVTIRVAVALYGPLEDTSLIGPGAAAFFAVMFALALGAEMLQAG